MFNGSHWCKQPFYVRRHHSHRRVVIGRNKTKIKVIDFQIISRFVYRMPTDYRPLENLTNSADGHTAYFSPNEYVFIIRQIHRRRRQRNARWDVINTSRGIHIRIQTNGGLCLRRTWMYTDICIYIYIYRTLPLLLVAPRARALRRKTCDPRSACAPS